MIGLFSQLQTTPDRLAYLRALSIGVLIEDATRIFMENEEVILAGKDIEKIENITMITNIAWVSNKIEIIVRLCPMTLES